MATEALETRFEQITLNDQNEDPQHMTSYHKSKVCRACSLEICFADSLRAHSLPLFLWLDSAMQ